VTPGRIGRRGQIHRDRQRCPTGDSTPPRSRRGVGVPAVDDDIGAGRPECDGAAAPMPELAPVIRKVRRRPSARSMTTPGVVDGQVGT